MISEILINIELPPIGIITAVPEQTSGTSVSTLVYSTMDGLSSPLLVCGQKNFHRNYTGKMVISNRKLKIKC